MISDKLLELIEDFAAARLRASVYVGSIEYPAYANEAANAKRRLVVEIEIYANEMAIEGLNRAADKIGIRATVTGKGQE